jgi:hypothetical protein
VPARFRLIGAAQVVFRELAAVRDSDGRARRREAGRVIVTLSTVIAYERRGGPRGEPAVLVDPVGISVPALCGNGMSGHNPKNTRYIGAGGEMPEINRSTFLTISR